MQTVIETPTFAKQAKASGVSEQELRAIIIQIAEDPTKGEIIRGTGGARKVRFRRAGGGKSGGYRTIHYYAADDVPVFMLAIYSKNQQDNISQAAKNELRKILSTVADDYRASVKRKVVQLKR